MNYLKRKWNDVTQYIYENYIQEHPLSDINLNIYTLTEGQQILNDLKIFPTVIEDIILEYCAIYRIDHMKPYRFEVINKNFYKACFTFVWNRDINTKSLKESIQCYLLNNNKDPMIWIDRFFTSHYLFWSLIIEYMVKKEIACKENNSAFSIVILSDHPLKIWDQYIQYRCDLNESWLIDDQYKINNLSLLQTSNKFKVTFTSLVHKPDDDDDNQYYDLLITDIYHKGLQNKEIIQTYHLSKQIICIIPFSSEAIQDVQQNVDKNYKTNIQLIYCSPDKECCILLKPFELTKELLIDMDTNKSYHSINDGDIESLLDIHR